MVKQIDIVRVIVAIFIAFGVFPLSAFARKGHDHDRYYYHGDRWHNNHSWFWFDAGVAALTIGAIAETLPPRHTTVVVSGTPYYYNSGVYYQSYPEGGYMVVPAPAASSTSVVPPAMVVGQNSFTVNIPNSQGGYTPVVIEKIKGGYRGPQGEFYSDFPSVEQLRLMYGN